MWHYIILITIITDGRKMEYIDFLGNNVSRLGFGTMRLPVTADGGIDAEAFQKMIDTAIEKGVNFFDTAVPYHSGNSELELGTALSAYPRESYFLSDKYPGHQVMPDYTPAPIFEKQLKKCNTEYFDYYLLHNIYENSLPTYQNGDYAIPQYFIEQKKAGRIKHLGFSSHARPDTLEKILDFLGDEFEFCLIQLNYLDWTMQDAKKKYEFLTKRGIQVMVMEPLRGGKLVNLSEEQASMMNDRHPGTTPAQWGFNWLRKLPNVRVILSGMSDPDQMEMNTDTFNNPSFIEKSDNDLLMEIAETMKNSLPCTACRYCCDGCPMGLDIPVLIGALNDMNYAANLTIAMQMDALEEGKRPSDCIGCGACTHICPQNIDIPSAMQTLADKLDKMPKWKEVCAEREKITDYR